MLKQAAVAPRFRLE